MLRDHRKLELDLRKIVRSPDDSAERSVHLQLFQVGVIGFQYSLQASRMITAKTYQEGQRGKETMHHQGSVIILRLARRNRYGPIISIIKWELHSRHRVISHVIIRRRKSRQLEVSHNLKAQ